MTEFRNPQSEPGSEKKLLIFIVLTFVAIIAMNYLSPKPAPQPPAGPGQPGQQATQTQPPPASGTAKPTRSPAAAQPVVSALPTVKAAAESESVIEDDYYKIVFSNRGAVAKSWILKKYKNDKGQPLDIVNPATAAALGYPLSLFSYDKDLEKQINEALYVPSYVGARTAPSQLSFEYSAGDTSVKKTFRFDKSSYVISLETQVTSKGSLVQAFPQWPGGFGDQTTLQSYATGWIDYQQNDQVTRQAAESGNFITGKKHVSGGQTISGPFNWAGVVDQYFATAFMPESPRNTALVTLNTQIDIPRNPEKPDDSPKDKMAILGVAVGSVNGITRERLFVGPRAVKELDATEAQPGGPDLRGILDFGFFSFISRPLFAWLRWTHEHWISNWGWAIAFLTVVISVALLPLRIAGMKSGLKMQKIQPQMKAIQEKYKRYGLTDPRRADMQKEIMALQKREGVNQFGGCLPMLLQLPFLWAFYQMLGNATELRQAGWLWIHDLSGADPFHVLPIAIVLLMYITQKSMPQTGMDPAQQKMMAVLTPVMMGVISWNLAAGLGIYWALSTFIGWVQQAAFNRTEFAKQVRKTVERRATRKR